MRTDEYASYLKKRNYFYSLGDDCFINFGACFTDPKYIKIGNNTCLSDCTLIGHEGSVSVYANATGKILDKVGKIEIGNNCFIGHGALILPNITIGNNCIVAAGAIVTKDVEENSIVGGNPAKKIGDTDNFIKRIEKETLDYPWYNLLKDRRSTFDSEIEKKLLPIRLEYFFGKT